MSYLNRTIRKYDHHKYTPAILRHNRKLREELGTIGNEPRYKWMLNTEIYVDIRRDNATGTVPIVLSQYKDLDTVPERRRAEGGVLLHVPDYTVERFTAAEILGEVRWLLGYFNPEQSRQVEAGAAGFTESSFFSYVEYPNSVLELCEWPTETLTDLYVLDIRDELSKASKQTIEKRKEEFMNMIKQHQDRLNREQRQRAVQQLTAQFAPIFPGERSAYTGPGLVEP